MTLLHRDVLGARRIFLHPASGELAADLRSLLARVPSARTAGLDPEGIAAAWSLRDAPSRTCLAAVRAVPPGRALLCDEDGRVSPCTCAAPCTCPTLSPVRLRSKPHPHPRSRPPLAPCLLLATQRCLATSRNPILALSGGLDAPLVLLAARRAGATISSAIHLSLPDTTYDESVAARETARVLGLTLHEVRATVDDLARELPRAVRAAETPLYNLHPVSRSLVARAARELGHDALLTGDGADQAARGAVGPADYVPVVAALTHGAGLTLASPFLDDEVAVLLADTPDPEKRALRALASVLGLPSPIADRPKIPASAPPLPRAAFPSAARLAELAPLSRALGIPFAWSGDDRRNVGIASLAAFVSAFELEVR